MAEELVEKKDSYFDGGLAQWIGWKIAGFFVTLLTLGICYPWAVCMIYKWKINHTVVNGRRLKFVGRAGGLFGLWIKWFLLTIITIGIYGFWVPISLEKWRVKHTIFADEAPSVKLDEEKTQDGTKNEFNKSYIPLIGVIVSLIFAVTPVFSLLGIRGLISAFQSGYVRYIVGSIISFLANIASVVAAVGLIMCIVAYVKKEDMKLKINLPLYLCIVTIALRFIGGVFFNLSYAFIHLVSLPTLLLLAGVIVAKVMLNKEIKQEDAIEN